jgi:hypothetical protein
MTYTFYHSGILIGESNLEDVADNRRQRAGIFRATAYGMDIFPRLTGILSAGRAFQEYLEANGLSLDSMERAEIDHLLDTVPAGQKIIDIGRMLGGVEIRAPNGAPLEFESIAFIDQLEWKRVGQLLGEPAAELEKLPPGVPRYVVSTTLRHAAPVPSRKRKASRMRSH